MNHKITITMLILFLIAARAIVPLSCAVNWSAAIRLTLDDQLDSSPSIAQATNGDIWVVWDSFRTGNYEIFCSIYDGSSWSDAAPLTANPHRDAHPAIVRVSNGDIWVVWDSFRTGNYEIFYKVYNGSSWCGAVPLTTDPDYDPYYDSHPAIIEANNGDMWVVWDSNRNGHDMDLYYSVFNGFSWSNATQLTTDPDTDDEDPSIMQATGGKVWVAFTKENATDEDIYYKIFDGTSWSRDIQVTQDPASDLHPSIMQDSDEAIWIVWDSDRNGHDKNIYCRIRDVVWTEYELTTDMSDDFMPSIAQAADGTIWVVWTSMREANFDIYYKTTILAPFHDITVRKVTVSPTVAGVGRNVSIKVTVQNQGTYGETFEVQCHANSTLIGSTTIFLSAGQANTIHPPFQWNTTGVPYGSYTISANATIVPGETDTADNTRVDGTVIVTILGDIDGDGDVDKYDFGEFAGAYGSEEGEPEYNPGADLDGDGDVDKFDFGSFAGNFGQSI